MSDHTRASLNAAHQAASVPSPAATDERRNDLEMAKEAIALLAWRVRNPAAGRWGMSSLDPGHTQFLEAAEALIRWPERVAQLTEAALQHDPAQKCIEELESLLAECVEPMRDACRYDHHGYCQTHFLHERPCPYERARAALASRSPLPTEGEV